MKKLKIIFLLFFLLVCNVVFANTQYAKITPENPKDTEDLLCDVVNTNAQFIYKWYVNGNFVKKETKEFSTLSNSSFKVYDTVVCRAYVNYCVFGVCQEVLVSEDKVVISLSKVELKMYPEKLNKNEDVLCIVEPNPKNYEYEYRFYINNENNFVKKEFSKDGAKLAKENFKEGDLIICKAYLFNNLIGSIEKYVGLGNKKVIIEPKNPLTKDNYFKCYVDPNVDNLDYNYKWKIYDDKANLVYEKSDFGKSAELNYDFKGKRKYVVECSATHSSGFSGSTRVEIANTPPEILSMNVPESAYVDEKVKFSANAKDFDENPLTYTWRINDRVDLVGKEVEYTFNNPGKYKVLLLVSDGFDVIKAEKSIEIKDLGDLNVEVKVLNDRIVVNEEQLIWFVVSDVRGKVQGSKVEMNNLECLTDANGYCEFKITESEAGKKEYTWKVTDKGRELTGKVSYEVVARRYRIDNLMLLNESLIESYDYYRKDLIYSQFRVYDLKERRYVEDLTDVSSKIKADGKDAEILMDYEGVKEYKGLKYYRFKATIPTKKEFVGTNTDYVFVFNINNEGGQDKISFRVHNRLPEITNLEVPSSAYVDEEVKLKSDAKDLDDDELIYVWKIDNEEVGRGKEITYRFREAKTYKVILEVSDGFDVIKAERNVEVVKFLGPYYVNVSLLNNKIVKGSEQIISVIVYDSNGYIENAKVKIQGHYNAEKLTNSEGAAVFIITETEIGKKELNYTVEVEGRNSTKGIITYEVIPKRYEIVDLVLLDSNFTQRASFYRGERFYVKFKVYDEIKNEFVKDVSVFSKLIDLTSGKSVDLAYQSLDNYTFTFSGVIPKLKEFAGVARTYVFAINVQNEGGQKYIQLTILNNPPTIKCDKDNLSLKLNEITKVECIAADDVDKLSLEIISNLLKADYSLNYQSVDNQRFTIVFNAVASGEEVISIKVKDSENSFAEIKLNVVVKAETQTENQTNQVLFNRFDLAKEVEVKKISVTKVGKFQVIELEVRNKNLEPLRNVRISAISRNNEKYPLEMISIPENSVKRVRIFIPEKYATGYLFMKNDYFERVVLLN
ncbi:MAG: PKD domain-containing protein [Candidatus Woesearchaeota archaeon]